MARANIAFLGLGKMGEPMVRNLLRAGFSVRGFDLNSSLVQALAKEPKFHAASSASDCLQGCATLILMLPDSKAVDALLWDETKGLAKQLAAPALLIDMGSSEPLRSRQNASQLKALGIDFLDAPVSGGVRRATDASLAIMVGGEAAAFEQAKPLLQAMGKTILRVGEAGAGHAVKALNNYVSASGLVAACEALVAAQKFGIDPHLVNQVFNASTGKNNTTEHKVENYMLSGSFASGFALSLMRKDLQTARNFIAHMDSPDELVATCLQLWEQAEKALGPGADHTAMYQFIQKH